MSTPEMQGFDKGFAHGYPRDRGLIERIQDETSLRTITEVIPETGDMLPSLIESGYPTFSHEEYSGLRVHYIPADARDLVELIRLGRDSQRTVSLGQLLGNNLRHIIQATHTFPDDTILPRFAGHSSNQNRAIGGVELRLLPPFDRFTAPRTTPQSSRIIDMIESELIEIDTISDLKFSDFITGFHYGFSHEH